MERAEVGEDEANVPPATLFWTAPLIPGVHLDLWYRTVPAALPYTQLSR